MSPSEPIRTCVGCRRRRSKAALTRFVAENGRLVAGAGRPGRGAWICLDTFPACFGAATSAKRWARALRTQVDTGVEATSVPLG